MEVELKLLLEPGEADRLRAALGTPRVSTVQYNRYFDDRERTLARNGWGLRVRLELTHGGLPRVYLTLKHSGEESGDFSARPEYETRLPAADLEPKEALRLARALLPASISLPDLVPLEAARLENHRDTFALPGLAPLVVELDHTVWPDGTVSDEVELEVPEGFDHKEAADGLRQFLADLGIPWRVGRESKLERLMRMV